VKVYVAAVEALREKERGVKTGWNSVYHQKKLIFGWYEVGIYYTWYWKLL
jgi:hypothetical protein